MPAVVRHFCGMVDGLDVASAGEMRGRARRRHARPSSSASPGPARRDAELEARRRGRHRDQHGIRARDAAPRATSRSRTGARPEGRRARQPGLRAQDLRHEDGRRPEAVRRRRRARARRCSPNSATLPLEFWGFHIYSGSQNLRPEILVDAQQKTGDARASNSRRHAPAPVRLLNLGGGFGIPYFPGREAARPRADRREPARRCCRRSATALPEATVALELGRYLVGESGVYVCR